MNVNMHTGDLPVGLNISDAEMVLFQVLGSLVTSADWCVISDVLVFCEGLLLDTLSNVFFFLAESATFFVCDMCLKNLLVAGSLLAKDIVWNFGDTVTRGDGLSCCLLIPFCCFGWKWLALSGSTFSFDVRGLDLLMGLVGSVVMDHWVMFLPFFGVGFLDGGAICFVDATDVGVCTWVDTAGVICFESLDFCWNNVVLQLIGQFGCFLVDNGEIVFGVL